MIENATKSRYVLHFKQIIKWSVYQKIYQILLRLISFFLIAIQVILKSKENLVLENLALRQQLTTFHIKKKQPKLANIDRLFWVALKQV